jgi:hypothetical protein
MHERIFYIFSERDARVAALGFGFGVNDRFLSNWLVVIGKKAIVKCER